MVIRRTETGDFPRVMEIYAGARAFMAEHGNPRQWGATNWPPADLILRDIELGKSFVCADGDRILAVFYFDAGRRIEPCYAEISEGAWVGDDVYGVVHRIASAEKGAGSFCINWAYERCGHLRMDTHPDNYVMRNLLGKLGFVRTGIIHVEEDDDPRIAYEKV